MPLCFTVDSVARPIISARIQFNGYYGCPWCYIPGFREENSMRYLKHQSKTAEDRTHEKYLDEVNTIKKYGNKTLHGVKGKSVIVSRLPFFDAIWGFPPEYMHGVLLGVTKQLWEQWLKPKSMYRLLPKEVSLVDERLTLIRPLRDMYRLPCQLQKKSKRKASDWLYWLLFYSLLCLQGILHQDALASYALLGRSIYTLLSNNISCKALVWCNKDLKRFVNDCEKYNGSKFMTFNVHSLIHLCKSVQQSGPLWATSAFSFESENGRLKQFAIGSHGVVEQITDRVLEHHKFKENSLKMDNGTKCKIFCDEVSLNFSELKNYYTSKENAIIPSILCQMAENQYDRCVFNGITIRSIKYDRAKLTNDTYVQLTNNRIAQVISFSLVNDSCMINIEYRDVSVLKINNL